MRFPHESTPFVETPDGASLLRDIAQLAQLPPSHIRGRFSQDAYAPVPADHPLAIEDRERAEAFRRAVGPPVPPPARPRPRPATCPHCRPGTPCLRHGKW